MEKKQTPSAREIETEKDPKKRAEKYNAYVEAKTPKFSCFCNCLKAFLVGGLICLIGEVLITLFENIGFSEEEAGFIEIILLVAASVILTGLNLYPRLAKWAGAGTVVPITGFANSVASCALDAKAEGQVFGIGCKIFTIAGPVILYGIVSSWLLGLIYWFCVYFKLV